MALHPKIAVLLQWIASFQPPAENTPERYEVLKDAERAVTFLLDQRLPVDALKPFQTYVADHYSEVSLDPRSVLASAALLKEVERGPLVPLLPDGWFKTYYLYSRGAFAPVEYSILLSFSILGAILGRQVYFDAAGRYAIYPPVSALLLSTQAGVGKGTALGSAKKLLRAVGYRDMAPDRISGSKLLSRLALQSAENVKKNPAAPAPVECCIFASELSGFYSMDDQSHGTLTVDIADLLDMPRQFTRDTQKHKEEIILKPTLTHVGCSVLSWLAENMPRNTFTGGWFARQYVSVQSPRDVPNLGMNRAAPIWALREAVQEIREIQAQVSRNGDSRGRRMRFGTGASEEFQRIERDALKLIHLSSDDRIIAYLRRLPTNALRMAMLLSVSQGKGEILKDEIGRAWEIMQVLEKSHGPLYARVGSTLYGASRQLIYDTILKATREAGFLSKGELKSRTSHLGIRFREHGEILADLQDTGAIEMIPMLEGSRGTLNYRATDPRRDVLFDPLRALREGKSEDPGIQVGEASPGEMDMEGPEDESDEDVMH